MTTAINRRRTTRCFHVLQYTIVLPIASLRAHKSKISPNMSIATWNKHARLSFRLLPKRDRD